METSSEKTYIPPPFSSFSHMQYRYTSEVSILFACKEMKRRIVSPRLVWLSARNESSKGERERGWREKKLEMRSLKGESTP